MNHKWSGISILADVHSTEPFDRTRFTDSTTQSQFSNSNAKPVQIFGPTVGQLFYSVVSKLTVRKKFVYPSLRYHARENIFSRN